MGSSEVGPLRPFSPLGPAQELAPWFREVMVSRMDMASLAVVVVGGAADGTEDKSHIV
jgi:hypothetical protein